MSNINNDFFNNNRGKKLVDSVFDASGRSLQLDLKTDMPADEGYTNILVAVDLTTGYVDAEATKTKKASDILSAFMEMKKRKIIKNIAGKKYIITDGGTEFLGEFRQFLLKNHMIHIVEDSYNKNNMSVIERNIGTITKPLLEHMSKQTLLNRRKETKWKVYLPKIVFAINNNLRRNNPRSTFKDLKKLPELPKRIIPIGTTVYKKLDTSRHLLNDKEKFRYRHGDKRYFEEESIVSGYRIRLAKPLRYYLDDDQKISYLPHQLLVAN